MQAGQTVRKSSGIAALVLAMYLILGPAAHCQDIPTDSAPEEPSADNPLLTIDHQHHDSLDDPYDTDTVFMIKAWDEKVSLVKITHTNSKKIELFLVDTYTGTNWRFMDGKILVKVDDTLIRLQAPKPYRDAYSGGVLEMLWAPITPAQIKLLAKATTLRIQSWTEPFDILDEGIAAIKNFQANVMEK